MRLVMAGRTDGQTLPKQGHGSNGSAVRVVGQTDGRTLPNVLSPLLISAVYYLPVDNYSVHGGSWRHPASMHIKHVDIILKY